MKVYGMVAVGASVIGCKSQIMHRNVYISENMRKEAEPAFIEACRTEVLDKDGKPSLNDLQTIDKTSPVRISVIEFDLIGLKEQE